MTFEEFKAVDHVLVNALTRGKGRLVVEPPLSVDEVRWLQERADRALKEWVKANTRRVGKTRRRELTLHDEDGSPMVAVVFRTFSACVLYDPTDESLSVVAVFGRYV